MKKPRIYILCLLCGILAFTAGCGEPKKTEFSIPTTKGSRDNTPVCLEPSSPGTATFSYSTYLVDYSNASEGYITASYTGDSPKVKFQITLPDGSLYTYNLTDKQDVFPLSSDSGTYSVGIFENISNNEYATLMFEQFDVQIENTFGAYLYPNQYVAFQAGDKSVQLGQDLALSANNELEVISNCYNYLISNIEYDHEKAEAVQSGYLPDMDAIIEEKKGICLDYAGLMACMLRSQKIPTHMEVGYAGTAYHAWISTYITDVGWVNGIIEFDGKNWQLMDPTFGASVGEKKLKKYIGDGENYRVKYIY